MHVLNNENIESGYLIRNKYTVVKWRTFDMISRLPEPPYGCIIQKEAA